MIDEINTGPPLLSRTVEATAVAEDEHEQLELERERLRETERKIG